MAAERDLKLWRAAFALVLAFAGFVVLAGSARGAWIVFDCGVRVCRVPASGGVVEHVGPRGARTPSLSPDGRHLAFAVANSVYVADSRGRHRRRVQRPVGDVSAAVWRRDSQALLWTRYTPGFGYFACRVVLGQRAKCFRLVRLFPTWGPGAGRLLTKEPERSMTICVSTFTGRCLHTAAVADPRGGFFGGSALSPDGRLLAAADEPVAGEIRLALFDVHSARRVRYVTHGHGDGYPAWSPDGRWLVFERDLEEPITGQPTRYAICVVRVTGGRVRCLAKGPHYHGASWGL